MTSSLRPHVRTWLAAVLTAAGVAGLAACDTGIANPAKGLPIVGNYRLVTVNGAPLPYQTASGYVVRGTLNIGANVQYSIRETDSSATGLSTFSSDGRWSIIAQQVTFMDNNSAVYVGTLTPQLDSIALQIGGHISVYAHD